MKTSHCILLLAQALSIAATPLPAEAREVNVLGRNKAPAATPAITRAAEAAPAATSAVAGGEEENKENEVEQAGQFDTPIALGGDNIKVDTLFPTGVNIGFEVEFQNAAGRTLTVGQNTKPANPPPGFAAVEPVSYVVNLAEGTDGITLQKVDFILNKNSTLDISKASVGRFCAEAGAFVIDPQVGELEFEAEENEIAFKVKNMNGEWALFVPQAAAESPATTTPVSAEKSQQLVDLLRSLIAA